MSEVKDDATPLAKLVLSGQGQTEAIAINDFIFMVKDISNAYLVTTADGDVAINTGFMGNGERNRDLLAPKRTGSLRTIILTQSHADHFGGVPEFQEEGTRIIVGKTFVENAGDMMRMMPYFGPRTRKLWGNAIPSRTGPPVMPPMVVPDVVVEKEYSFEQGGRRFELLLTPDGETTDSLTVWLPQDRIAFTGNLLGPVFLSMPFLSTLRGDKPRLVRSYLSSLDKLRSLGAEVLITGHGDPILGADRIRADLDKLHAAVSYVRDYTLDGMRAGKDLHALMREFRFPDEIRIGEFHGKGSWAVRTIWIEYSGWFQHASTTELYGVPFWSVHADLAELAGGASALAERAAAKLAAGKPLEAIHLVEIALGSEPGNRDALQVSKAAHERLLAESGGTNLSETGWLKSEITAAENKLSAAG
jgi:glyoxylase-like metal-dependent hydrolase (beta-lactamase superfamily II)